MVESFHGRGRACTAPHHQTLLCFRFLPIRRFMPTLVRCDRDPTRSGLSSVRALVYYCHWMCSCSKPSVSVTLYEGAVWPDNQVSAQSRSATWSAAKGGQIRPDHPRA